MRKFIFQSDKPEQKPDQCVWYEIMPDNDPLKPPLFIPVGPGALLTELEAIAVFLKSEWNQNDTVISLDVHYCDADMPASYVGVYNWRKGFDVKKGEPGQHMQIYFNSKLAQMPPLLEAK